MDDDYEDRTIQDDTTNGDTEFDAGERWAKHFETLRYVREGVPDSERQGMKDVAQDAARQALAHFENAKRAYNRALARLVKSIDNNIDCENPKIMDGDVNVLVVAIGRIQRVKEALQDLADRRHAQAVKLT